MAQRTIACICSPAANESAGWGTRGRNPSPATDERRSQATHHLHRSGTVVADLIECQRQIVLPRRHRENETQIAIRMELDKMTLSDAMRVLERLHLVDRGPDMFCRGWRIWVTKKGMDMLEEGRNRVAGMIEMASFPSAVHRGTRA